jgi:acetyl-CoA C-acetyltransferase
VLGYAHAGVRPEVMGIGPVPAVQKLLERPACRSAIST